MNDKLLEVFKNVNDWLKFAEAKNAMLIGLNGVLIFGTSQLEVYSFMSFGTFWSGYLSIVQLLLVFSIVVCLLSFVPKVKIKKRFSAPNPTSNLWFFEHLKSCTIDDIIKNVGGITPSNASQLDRDLAIQIKVNSDIASIKYSYFAIAIWMTIVAILTLPLAALFLIYFYYP